MKCYTLEVYDTQTENRKQLLKDQLNKADSQNDSLILNRK